MPSLLYRCSLLFSLSTLVLVLLLLQQRGWSLLQLGTLAFLLSWPLAALWYGLWQRSKQQLQQLRLSLGQALQQASSASDLPVLPEYRWLQQDLAQWASQQQQQAWRPDDMLWQQLPFPVCLFDQQLKLRFANPAASQAFPQPLLLGSPASSLGFLQQKHGLQRPELTTGWQQLCLTFGPPEAQEHLYYALDLRHPLYQQQKHSQQQLIRVLSHELRNSLTPMASMTETLLSQPQLTEQQTRLVLERIQQRSQRLLAFIDQYAKVQQLPAGQPEWCDLTAVVDELQLTSPIPLIVDGERSCYADPNQLRQLLLNLAKNAAEAGGDSADTRVQITAYQQGQQQWLLVRDNGPGFANIDNLFTPFYTTKTGGSGIGLMLCREIVMQHGGNIEARNLVTGGAELVMRWPMPIPPLASN